MKYSFVIFFSIVISLFVSCHKEVGEKDNEIPSMQPAKTIDLTKTQLEIVGRNNIFAFNLFQSLGAKSEGSFLYSPFSVESVLSMLLNGAKEETFSQIASTLNYNTYSIDEINNLYSVMATGLAEADKTVMFTNANALWTNNIYPKAAFSSSLDSFYKAHLQQLDFSSPESVKTINDWCRNNTNGMVQNIIDGLDPNSLAIISNALYFEGSWKSKFDLSETTDEFFYTESNDSLKVKMMHKAADLIAAEVEGTKMCLLPFGNGAYQLALILPAEGSVFKQFISRFDISKYQSLRRAKTISEVHLSVPRLSLDCKVSGALKNSLIELGLKDAFNQESANFKQLCDGPLYIDSIMQKAHFEMDENGAKFAVVTSTDMGAEALLPPMEFNANRPFAFLIYENSTGTILFMGTYAGAE